MTETKLTDRQREFAGNNHHILEDFLSSRRLSAEDFYDIAVFGFLDAVKRFDEQTAQSGTFESIAEYCMEAELDRYFEEKRCSVKTLSLDHPLRGRNSLTLGDIIEDRHDFCTEVCARLSRVHYKPVAFKGVMKIQG